MSGAAALLLSADPTLTASDLKERLMNHGDAIGSLNGKVASGSRLNMTKALLSVIPDTTPPTITVENILLEATGSLTEVDLSQATSTDVIDGVIAPTPDKTGPFAVGEHTVRWSATDSAGNTATVTQTVTIQDTTAPSLVVPANITLEATASLTPVDLGAATATDIVDGSLTPTPSTTGPFGVGVYSIEWSVADSAENTTTASQIVTIQDTTPPTFDLVEDLVVGATDVLTTVDLQLTATDLVDGSITATPDQTGPFALGTHVITWTATDQAGNNATVTQTVVVEDTIAPVFTALEMDRRASPDGEPVWHTIRIPQVTDASSVTLSHNQLDYLIRVPVGVTTVVWTARDTEGNESTLEQQIEVVHLGAANLITPTEDTLLNGDTVFTWDTVEDAEYSLAIGTEPGTDNLFNQHVGSATSVTVPDLPNDIALFVRLNTHIDANWVQWHARASFNDYVFNTVDPAVAYYPNHSGLIACEVETDILYDQHQGDVVWVLNPDNYSVSMLNVTRDPQTHEIVVDAKNDYFVHANSRPSSISRVDEFVAITYEDTGFIRFNHIYQYGGSTTPWTSYLLRTEQWERPIASVAHDKFLYVALYGSGEVIKIDAVEKAIVARLKVGPKPRAMALTSDGSRLLVTRHISDSEYGEVYDINTAGDMSFRDPAQPSIRINKVWVPDAADHGSGVPNYLRGIVIDKDNRYAYVTANKSNIERGQALSGEPLTGDNTVRSMVAIIDLHTHQDVNVDATTREGTIDINHAADPSAISFLPDGVTRVHALRGNNQVELVNTQNNTSTRINVGGAPQSVCQTANALYVKNYTSRSITAIDTASYLNSGDTSFSKTKEVITVSSDQETLSSEELLGLQLFNHARQPDLSTQGNMSCASCHDDGGHDGMTWDFTQLGEGLRNTLSLNGSKGIRFGALNWSGHADEIQDVEKKIEQLQGGEGLIAGQTFTDEAGDEVTTTGASSDLDAIAAYLSTLGKESLMYTPHNCPNGDSACMSRHWIGYNLVISHGCLDCHKKNDGVSFNRGGIWKDGLTHDVGTVTSLSGQRSGETLSGIRTPTFAELWDSAPYLHDGSAETLHEVMNTGVHGSYGLDDGQIDMLVEFINRMDRLWHIEDDVYLGDPNAIQDSDGDGIADEDDPFPNDSTNQINNSNWASCANEGWHCVVPIPAIVRYGVNDQYAYREIDASIRCNSNNFGGDPAMGHSKSCQYLLSDQNDYDGDTVVDSDDAFPEDSSETHDSDGDGIGDNADPFPTDATNEAANTNWVFCGNEREECLVPATATVRYGAGDQYAYQEVDFSITCTNANFLGDPAPGIHKTCEYLIR